MHVYLCELCKIGGSLPFTIPAVFNTVFPVPFLHFGSLSGSFYLQREFLTLQLSKLMALVMVSVEKALKSLLTPRLSIPTGSTDHVP